jgi:spermidine synthase
LRQSSIRAAFLISGMAGLVYEVLWSRYLGLYVGHGAYAQVLVLSVYLGGMAVGSLAVAERSKTLTEPLRWYAAAEGLLALFGLAFHVLFVFATDLSYSVLFPALGNAAAVGAGRWAIAGLLILPQAIILGTTFPLMAAGLVRNSENRPGDGVAQAYLLNTLGGAAGVLLCGFWLIGWLGLPGTSVAAAFLNLAAAGLVLRSIGWKRLRTPRPVSPTVPGAMGPSDATARSDSPPSSSSGSSTAANRWASEGVKLLPILLFVSFATAFASFAYEIAWIRMLSLVLGSATHAFELMLSAFILGIALGAFWIRNRVDQAESPIRLLGVIQVLMGLTALASVPVYLWTFGLMSTLVGELSDTATGYALFNLSRYGLCLLVMLPSTVLAGMTLPLITGSLMRNGEGEEAIGRVFSINTFGSVVGAGLAGLIMLPLLGLKGLIVAGAAIDAGVGVWLIERSGRWNRSGPRLALLALAASTVVFLAVGTQISLDPVELTSGVFRKGLLAEDEPKQSLYYQDGRTATVSAHVSIEDGVIVVSTNGKPDASLGSRWLAQGRDTLPARPIRRGRDFSTQLLAPMVGLAHRPDSRSIANIGHGSGLTASAFLTSPTLERIVTLEIEPLMVEASRVFLPANETAFSDPRASYVFDDAKSYFAYQGERFDLIFAEPGNPWVSGTASLFTREFYERVTDFLTDDGILTQWIQVYELNDELLMSVLAALDAVFPTYRAYLVGDADIAIVAQMSGVLPEPDWSILGSPGFRELAASAPPFLAQHMNALLLFDQNTFGPLFDSGVTQNSDFHPILDLGAERTRFEQSIAEGFASLVNSRVDLAAHISGRAREPHPYEIVPAYGLTPVVMTERAAWLRAVLASGGGIAPEEFPDWQPHLVNLENFLSISTPGTAIASWEAWLSGFFNTEASLHWGTSHWVAPGFYPRLRDFLDEGARAEVVAAVSLMESYQLRDWAGVAAAADVLVGPVTAGERLVPPDVLLDLAVLSYLEIGRPDAARSALDALTSLSTLPIDNVRHQLFRELIRADGG